MGNGASVRRRVLRGRALLVATAGAATVVYLGCGPSRVTSGNLVAPITDASRDQTDDFGISSGNLVAPPPPPSDAGDAGDARTDAPADAASDGPSDAGGG